MIPSQVSHITSTSHLSSLSSLLLRNRRSGREFLLDSGADISVLPASKSKLSGPETAQLVAANRSIIRAFGSRTLQLSFDGLSASHSFMIAAVKKPILGEDFFSSNGPLICAPWPLSSSGSSQSFRISGVRGVPSLASWLLCLAFPLLASFATPQSHPPARWCLVHGRGRSLHTSTRSLTPVAGPPCKISVPGSCGMA